MRSARLLILLAALWSYVNTSVAGRAVTTTNDGVFSAEQAREGRTLFNDVCIACHVDPFWKANWRGKPLSDLYTTIRRYMPDDNPGTLTDREAAAALAYILDSNGVPAGRDPLPSDPQKLAEIAIAEPIARR